MKENQNNLEWLCARDIHFAGFIIKQLVVLQIQSCPDVQIVETFLI